MLGVVYILDANRSTTPERATFYALKNKSTNHISFSLHPSTIIVKAEVSHGHVIYRKKNTGRWLAFIPTGRVRRKPTALEYRGMVRA